MSFVFTPTIFFFFLYCFFMSLLHCVLLPILPNQMAQE